ncbi:MAG: magnesium/cobalt transporter CorA [Anaerolineaceae bacterium]|nr:magnesium/cobalt transporter CorA [Anaerolineaceae bacterium]
MIKSILHKRGSKVKTNLEINEFALILHNSEDLLWVDLSGEDTNYFEPILKEIFNFHPLSIDDALKETHIPRVDDWGDYLYLVFRGIVLEINKNMEVHIPELDIFLGKNYIVTYHEYPISAVDKIWDLYLTENQSLKIGPVNLLYRIVNELINQYFPAIEQIDEVIDKIEESVFANPGSEVLNQIFNLKRILLSLRRTFLPQREVLNKLSRDDFKLIQKKDQIYFRDLYDHLVRLHEINEGMRDLVNGALEMYLSVVNNRMNEIMKILTFISVLFMPLTFLTGFFGMNFFQAVLPLESWTGTIAFLMVLSGMIIIPLSMFFWMRWRSWM